MLSRAATRWPLVATCGLLMACGSSAERAAGAYAADAHAIADVARIDEALKAGRSATAADIQSLERVLAQHPEASAARQVLTAALVERRDWATVFNLLSAVPGETRTAADAEALASAAFQLGRYEEALAALQPLLTGGSPGLEVAVLSAHTQFRLGHYAAAAAPLDAVWTEVTRRDHVDAMALRGLLHYHQREYRNAVEVLERVLRLQPDHVAANNTLGRLYAEQGDAVRAETHLAAARAALDRVSAAERQAASTVQSVIELQEGWKAKNYLLVVDRAERLLPTAGPEQQSVLYQYLVEAYRFLGRPQDAERAAARLRALQP